MERIQVILGDVMLVVVAISAILGVVILVLLEARLILGLWVALHRRWRTALQRLREETGDEPEKTGASAPKTVPGPRGG